MSSRSSGSRKLKRGPSSGPTEASHAISATRSSWRSSRPIDDVAEPALSSALERLRATSWPVDLDHLRWLVASQIDSPRRGSAAARDSAHRALEIGEARERTRVARELHDSLGGDLAAAIALFKYYFENPTRSRAAGEVVLRNIHEILELSMKNLRAMLRSMRSHEIGARGLVGDLMDIAEAYRRNHGMDVALDAIGSEEELTQAQQEVVFQVVREALSNVRRHSGSLTCLVKLNFAGQPFVVEVTDRGVGVTDRSPDGYGLVGMRERAAGIGGRLQVVSAPGRGTTIFLFGPQQPLS